MTSLEQDPTTVSIEFEERLWPSVGYWVGAVVFVAISGVAVWVAHTGLGIFTVAVAAVLLGAGIWFSSARIAVADSQLRAGPARIALQWCGQTQELDAQGVKQALGPGADARVFGLVRPWVKTAVLVEITDPQDPTPAWLISTRRPAQLAQALNRPRA